jgi:hypothetical protein
MQYKKLPERGRTSVYLALGVFEPLRDSDTSEYHSAAMFRLTAMFKSTAQQRARRTFVESWQVMLHLLCICTIFSTFGFFGFFDFFISSLVSLVSLTYTATYYFSILAASECIKHSVVLLRRIRQFTAPVSTSVQSS